MDMKRLAQLRNDRVALESFDGVHLLLVTSNRKHQARAGRFAIYQNPARPADADFAPDVRAGQIALITQVINEQQTRRNVVNNRLAVDLYGNFHLIT
jgi:hypothetical protein